MLYVVGDQQDLHFAQCFKILSLLEDCPFDASEKLEHINFGRVKGMATRSGDVVFLKQILDTSQETMMKQMKASPERFAAIEDPEHTSDQIGMTAVKVQDMQAKRIMSYPFDWNRMTSFEGDTGPYLQYAHVRLCSMERKVAVEDGLTIASLELIDTSLLLSTPKAREIVFYLATFPDVVKTALKTQEPSNLVTYCFKLAHLISSAWETIVVKGLMGRGERGLAEARLLLYRPTHDLFRSLFYKSPDMFAELSEIAQLYASGLAAILGDEVSRVAKALIKIPHDGPHDLTLAVSELGPVLNNENPSNIAAKVAENYPSDELIQAVEASDSLLKFYIHSAPMMHQVLGMIYAKSRSPGPGYGTNTLGNGKRVVIEFSSPEIGKPFQEDHLRSTIIGTALSNLYAANGWDVIRLNYLGDGGTERALLAIWFKEFKEERPQEAEEQLQKNPIFFLNSVLLVAAHDFKANRGKPKLDTIAKINDHYKLLEDANSDPTAMLNHFRELSISQYTKIYKRLGVQFDVYAGSLLVSGESIKQVMHKLRQQGLLVGESTGNFQRPTRAAPQVEELEGKNNHGDTRAGDLALNIDLNEFHLGEPLLQEPGGRTTEIVRDIAEAIDRYHKYHFDKMLYVGGGQQTVRFARCFKILSLLGDCPFDASEKLEHINFGRFKGQVDPRWDEGKLVFLDWLMDWAKDKVMEKIKASTERLPTIGDIEGTSDQIGMTAIKVQDMQARRSVISSPLQFMRSTVIYRSIPYTFDWDKMTSFEGDTGPYLQYAHVQLCSLERNADGLAISSSSLESIDTSLLQSTPNAREIVFLLATFPDVVRTALKTHEPNTLVTYCFKLARLVNSARETIVITGLVDCGEKKLAEARLLLYICARNVLGSAMRMLSLTPLERM
ncbi:hypothetical protein FRC01_008525 [Tulasnella sp. 417]|nr:hypothetical protein FRC01_008525 [Tulasnella sp. 417]